MTGRTGLPRRLAASGAGPGATIEGGRGCRKWRVRTAGYGVVKGAGGTGTRAGRGCGARAGGTRGWRQPVAFAVAVSATAR